MLDNMEKWRSLKIIQVSIWACVHVLTKTIREERHSLQHIGAFRKISIKHSLCLCLVLPASLTEMDHVSFFFLLIAP